MEERAFQEILEGLKKSRALHEQGIRICDYIRALLDLEQGKEDAKKEAQTVIVQEKNENANLPLLENKPKEGEVTRLKHVRHRKDGRWEFTYMKNGIRFYAIAGTQTKLLEKIKAHKEAVKEKAKTETRKTFVGWIKYWLKTYKASTDTRNYSSVIKNHIAPYFKNMETAKLTPAILQEFINSLPPNSRTLDYAYLTLKQSLKQAYINEKTTRNLADTILKPRKVKTVKRTGLSMQEQVDLLHALKSFDQDVQYFVIFSIIAGTRRGETQKFKLEDIDEARLKIRIRGTKTELSDRKIKVSQGFIDFLKKKNTNFFTRQVDFYTDAVKEVFKKAKLPQKTLHDLRHTCSTNLHYLGWPDVERQAYLGHASIVMTNDIYTNLQEDITKNELLKLYDNLYLEM